MKFANIQAFFFDMDGVLSVGKEHPRYLGGREVVARIKDTDRQAFLLTNDSTHTRHEIQKNLRRLGFVFQRDDILTSSYLAASYLTENVKRDTAFFLLGERGFRQELENAGHHAADAKPDAVVVGLDRHLTYKKLNAALQFLRKGALLVGGYGGTVYMSEDGPAMSAGPIIKALEYASGRNAIMIGKPSTHMFRLALRRAAVKAPRAVMVGDQTETDLKGAHQIGLHTVLVLSGVETKESIRQSTAKPEMILKNVDQLINYI